MSPSTHRRRAARNNAVWCDTLCRAHGLAGTWHDEMWLQPRPSPRYYPNVVTLAAEVSPAALAELPSGSSVKDSFASLDLTPLGFHMLFEAEWLGWPADRLLPAGAGWTLVRQAAALRDWEDAWGTGNDESRLFVPALLEDPEVRFLAAHAGGRVVAGAIANRSDDVVGLSNLFLPAGGERLRAGALVALADAFPGLPVVGYERDANLSAMRALGFASLGPLRVWWKR